MEYQKPAEMSEMRRYCQTSDHATSHKEYQETAEMSEMRGYCLTSDHATSHVHNQKPSRNVRIVTIFSNFRSRNLS